MRIAVSAWNGRISPVFDTSGQVLLVDMEQGTETQRSAYALPLQDPPRRVATLTALGADVLLCGAISRPLAEMLQASGIWIVPFLAGEEEDVLAAYMSGGLPDPRYSLPGCSGKRHRHRHGPERRRGRTPQA